MEKRISELNAQLKGSPKPALIETESPTGGGPSNRISESTAVAGSNIGGEYVPRPAFRPVEGTVLRLDGVDYVWLGKEGGRGGQWAKINSKGLPGALAKKDIGQELTRLSAPTPVEALNAENMATEQLTARTAKLKMYEGRVVDAAKDFFKFTPTDSGMVMFGKSLIAGQAFVGKILVKVAVVFSIFLFFVEIGKIPRDDPHRLDIIKHLLRKMANEFGAAVVFSLIGAFIGAGIGKSIGGTYAALVGAFLSFWSGLAAGILIPPEIPYDKLDQYEDKLIIMLDKYFSPETTGETIIERQMRMLGISGLQPASFNSNEKRNQQKISSLTFDATKITIDAEEFLMTNSNLGYGGGDISPGMGRFGGGNGLQNASFTSGGGGNESLNSALSSGAGRVDAPNITATPGMGLGKTDTGPNLPAKDIIDFFVSQGWSPAQAAGIAGNLQQESSLDHSQSTLQKNNGVEYYGLAQWSPERQKDFKVRYGKDIRQSTALEQLQFIQDELTGKYKKRVADRLRQETTPDGAARLFNEEYEVGSETEKRMRYSKDFFSQYSNQGANLNNLSGRNEAARQNRNIQIPVPGPRQNNNQNGLPNMSYTNPGRSSYGESAFNRIIQLVGA